MVQTGGCTNGIQAEGGWETHPHPIGPFRTEAKALKPESDARLAVALFIWALVTFLGRIGVSKRGITEAHTGREQTFLRILHV